MQLDTHAASRYGRPVLLEDGAIPPATPPDPSRPPVAVVLRAAGYLGLAAGLWIGLGALLDLEPPYLASRLQESIAAVSNRARQQFVDRLRSEFAANPGDADLLLLRTAVPGALLPAEGDPLSPEAPPRSPLHLGRAAMSRMTGSEPHGERTLRAMRAWQEADPGNLVPLACEALAQFIAGDLVAGLEMAVRAAGCERSSDYALEELALRMRVARSWGMESHLRYAPELLSVSRAHWYLWCVGGVLLSAAEENLWRGQRDEALRLARAAERLGVVLEREVFSVEYEWSRGNKLRTGAWIRVLLPLQVETMSAEAIRDLRREFRRSQERRYSLTRRRWPVMPRPLRMNGGEGPLQSLAPFEMLVRERSVIPMLERWRGAVVGSPPPSLGEFVLDHLHAFFPAAGDLTPLPALTGWLSNPTTSGLDFNADPCQEDLEGACVRAIALGCGPSARPMIAGLLSGSTPLLGPGVAWLDDFWSGALPTAAVPPGATGGLRVALLARSRVAGPTKRSRLALLVRYLEQFRDEGWRAYHELADVGLIASAYALAEASGRPLTLSARAWREWLDSLPPDQGGK